MEDESILIRRLKNGDTKAMQPLMEKYQDYIYTLIIQIVKSSFIAEELTQDVFIKIYKKIDSFKGDAKFSTWIYTIAYRTGLNHLDKKKIVFNISELNDKDENIVSGENSFSESLFLHDSEVNKILWTAIDSIPLNQGIVITLHYLQQFSVKEIAEMMDVPENTIKTNLFRGRSSLKSILSKKFSEEELL